MRGFISIKKSEMRVRGGTKIDWSVLTKVWNFIKTAYDFVSTYGKDFMKGYRDGYNNRELVI